MRFVPGHFLTEMTICPANGEVLKKIKITGLLRGLIVIYDVL